MVGMLLFLACDPPVQHQPAAQQNSIPEKFVDANRYMQQRHQDHISAFVERVGWEAEVTPSGLWIVMEKAGNGNRVVYDARVTYSFTSQLLDGTPCYKASEQEPRVIRIGTGGVETGVEEGLNKLQEGAIATFIIPPYLAHGNFGDRNKIPGNSVVIYKVKVLEVQ